MDQTLLGKLLRYVRVCDAVYASSMDAFCQEAAVSQECVLRAHAGGLLSPKCMILANHEHQELILVVRGTASLLDFCTDLCLHNESFQNGQGHRGMVHAATWLVHHLGKDLKELSEKYADYRIVVTGHSLGAAVAALSAMQLRKEFPTIQCYAFGTPACVTQELATSSYDFVTTIVNGYDCVPRLHQHSLMKLQDEIRSFDWRATLKKMVADEIHKQKVAVETQQRAKLEELQATLRRMNPLQVKQRTSKATAKLEEVKRAASDNIMEFAHDVDTLLADKLDAALSIFKTETLSLEHVSFVKNLLKFEDIKKGDSFWWKCMNESIAALERLSSAVKKPEELEQVLIELKGVLQKTSASSRKLLDRGDDHDIATESNRLQLFRSRVDDILDKTRASVKARISDQVSKVSTTVSSSVKGYVGTIKEETEALGTIAQEELDHVVDTVYRNVPFFVGWNSKTTSDHQSSRHDKERHCDEMSVDACSLQRIENETEEKSGQEREDLKHDHVQVEQDNTLHHDPLFPPGRIIYLNRRPSAKDEAGNSATSDMVEVVEVATDDFSRVVLSNRMLLDHLCTDYEQVLQCQAKLLESPPDST
ncbi:unnamed protein product [Peronospora belbahrii]|uniref:Fungal lipase-type domain-containing protein n=1 Tax=Peronospora belbahrii TaxID=622444 RepID=A0ABN8CZQ2_9STRA|nr:unnamed protein product [Peronospora belbahrii]